MESTRYPASAMGRAIERLKAKKLLETNGYSVTKGKNHKKYLKTIQNYSKLWNRRTSWNKRSTPLKNYHIRILIHFYIKHGIVVIFLFQKLMSVPLRLFQTLESRVI